MPKFVHTLFLVFCYLYSFSQDQHIGYDDLSFNSAFEARSIQNYTENNTDYFNLFISIDPNITQNDAERYHAEYAQTLERLKAAKYLKKSNSKKIKKLYEEVHSAFLNKYEIQNLFSQVFTTGYYNCVSSSALYGLIFNDLEIPFTIKEKPTHVYLMSYPKSDQILVETTDPTGNFLKYSDNYKSAVVASLREAKLISEEEYGSKPTDRLFNEFYFSDQDIGLKELVGIQYLNDALYKLDKNDLAAGYKQLEKAYFFYPKENLAAMLIVISVQILDKMGYKDIESMNYMEKLSRLRGLMLTTENILAEFEKMTQIKLTEQADTAGYRKFYKAFLTKSDDEELNSEVSYIYNLRRGLALYNTGNFSQSLPFLEKAYTIKPKNLDVNGIYISAIGQKLSYESENHEIIKTLEEASAKHPALIENNVFKSMLMNSYVIAFGQAFDLNNEKEGLHYKKLFEQYYENGLNVHASNLGRAYSLAAVYYFKKGYTSKAKNIIKQGLSYAPGNYELLNRQRMIR